jgi:hypothetical protein
MQKQEHGIGDLQPRAFTEDRRRPVLSRSPTRGASVLTLVQKPKDARARERVPNPPGTITSSALRRPPRAETFTGSVETAREEARRVINEPGQSAYVRIVEGWQQLPDGQIQFTIRTLFR